MPTPIYELETYFKKQMEDARRSKLKTILGCLAPLCFVLAITGRISAIGMLLFIGLMLILPSLLGYPDLDISEKGVVAKFFRGRCFVGWDSLGAFSADTHKNSTHLLAPIIGKNVRTFLFGLHKKGGQKFLMIDLPVRNHSEAIRRLTEYQETLKNPHTDAGEPREPL